MILKTVFWILFSILLFKPALEPVYAEEGVIVLDKEKSLQEENQKIKAEINEEAKELKTDKKQENQYDVKTNKKKTTVLYIVFLLALIYLILTYRSKRKQS